jgi:hypothetical protein
MRKKMAFLVVALAFLGAASAAWCQDAIYVKMPVKGLQYESSRQEIFSYEGDVHLFWIPSTAVSSAVAWTVVGILDVESSGLFCCRGATFRGFSIEKITATSGDVVPLEIEFRASDFGGDPWFQSRMRVYATVPK